MYDIHNLLNSSDALEYQSHLRAIKTVGSVLLREGFRNIFIDTFKSDITHMAKSYLCLRKIAAVDDNNDKHQNMTETQKQMSAEGLSFCECSDCWVTNSLKLLMMGLKDTLNWLIQCKVTLSAIEKSKNEGKGFVILAKYG